MSETLQWVIVAIAVAAATVYLYRRLLRPRRVGDCSSCSSCPLGADYAATCEKTTRGKQECSPRKP